MKKKLIGGNYIMYSVEKENRKKTRKKETEIKSSHKNEFKITC
jgi:hypothetical protein